MAQTNSSSPNPPVGGVSIIILCGLPGSGKTTLSCQLKKHLEEKVRRKEKERGEKERRERCFLSFVLFVFSLSIVWRERQGYPY